MRMSLLPVNYPRRLDAAERFEAGELMIFGKTLCLDDFGSLSGYTEGGVGAPSPIIPRRDRSALKRYDVR